MTNAGQAVIRSLPQEEKEADIRTSERQALNDTGANIKIEVIVTDEKMAHEIAEKVAEDYLSNYSGIVFLENIQIVRPEKFVR